MFLAFSFLPVFAQKTSPVFLPDKSATMPEWMNLFYNGITNAEEIETAYNLYYQTHSFEKNTFTQYYKRWMIEQKRHPKEDGTASKPENNVPQPPEIKHTLSSTNTWSVIGPLETFQPAWNSASQPSVPWQVNLYAFDVAPSNPNILYSCPETGGIFKTTDKGLNWFSVSDNVRLGTVEAIAVHPANPDIVYASADNNVYKTTDGGASWNTIFTASGLNCNDIAIFTKNPNIVFLAGANGLYKSTNAGANFSLVTGITGTIYDIETNPLRDSSVFILRKATGDSLVRFYRSYDAGANFTLINQGWTSGTSNAGRMTVTPADSNYIYSVLLMGGSIGAPIILRSKDAGTNWVQTCTGTQNNLTGNDTSPLGMSNGQGYYDLSIMASTMNPREVIVGTTSAYKSLDTGNTFKSIGGYTGAFTLHPDIQEMKMIGNDAWISTDGGLNYSPDFYSSTTNASVRIKGIYGSDFWGYGQGWNEDLATGGRYHNGNTAMYDGYPAGKSLRLGGGEASTGYGMVGRDMYVAHSDIGASVMPRTFNGSKSDFAFTLYPNEDGYGWDPSELEFYPECYKHIYIGKDSSLWKSIDGGVSYSQIYNFHQRVKKFDLCRSNPIVMYLATNLKLYKTTDGGNSWTILTLPAGASVNEMSLSVSYSDENILWMTSVSNSSNNKVFKTTNGGTSWTNLTTPAINSYSYLVINHQAGTDGGVYITSSDYAKVFYRNNTMTDWVDYSGNLPKEYKPLTSKPFYMKNQLRTAGNRGIWKVDFYENGLPVAQPTVDKLESYCVRDTFYFDDFSAVNHALASWEWSFPGATYVSATNVRNPKVMYADIGAHTATLTVTQNGNKSSKSVTVKIVSNACAADTIPGFAIAFGGNLNKDYASIPQLSMNTNELTITAWIKADSIQPDYSPIFMRDGDAAGFDFLPGANHLGFHWPTGPWWWDSGLIVPVGEWTHVAMVVSPAEIRLFVNGKSSAYSFKVPKVDFGLNTNRLGNYQGWDGRYFKGMMDEICIWNRTLTTDEIRATRHLTKKPTIDTTIAAYYQFNELSGEVLDKVGTHHAILSSGVKRIISNAPFASGNSSKLSVTTGGTYTFPSTDIKMTLPSKSGYTYPNGDVWVTKLNYHPDQNANPYPVVNNYWIVNNYGSNSVFSTSDSIIFSGLPALSITNPNNYYLYKRNTNADGNTWSSPQDTADVYNLNGNNSQLIFSLNNSVNSFGQFSINALSLPNTGVLENNTIPNFELNVYPNPANDVLFLELNSVSENKNSGVNIYDTLGKQLITSKQNIKQGKNILMLNTLSLPNGTYLLNAEIDGTKKTAKIIISR